MRTVFASSTALGFLLSASAMAAPLSFTRPNIITTPGSTSASLGGQTFVNQGLQGVARLPATSTLDFNGDTFGAFSSLDVLPGSWRKTATGYGGTLYSLPDRGPNGVGSVTFSDYPGRTSIFSMDFTPYTGSASLPVSASSQHQLQLTQTGGFFFRDFNNNLTTGLDPGTPGATAFVTQNGKQLPGSSIGPAAGKISLDAEGLRFLNNGNFYVSDEYGANVYYFDATGRMQGVIQPPAALFPRDSAGNLSFTSLTDATVGRRVNQGLEGMDITPDGKKLVTLLQSAAMQDSTSAQQTRTNTRLMIYDISQGPTPTTPIADYVVQLPIYRSNGDGAAPDRTAAQSELLALNDTQFLMLSRDANGLGQANLPFVFKSVVLVDTAGATNIAGTAFETSYTSLSPGGVLNSSITPVNQVELVNILNSTQLGKFGINLNNATPTSLTLTEKWEGMALVPVLEESAPQDYFLLIGNDNDFLSSTCKVGGQNCAQSVNSDALVLVYRLTLPTYVDSSSLQSMLDSAPTAMGMTLQASRSLAGAYDIGQHLKARRHGGAVAPAQFAGLDLSVWAGGSWARQNASAKTFSASIDSATLGLDALLNENLLLGVAVGGAWGGSDTAAGLSQTQSAYQFSLYGAFQMDGFFADLSATHSDQHFRNILRPAAYGLTGNGRTDGDAWGVTGEAGYMIALDDVQLAPLAGFQLLDSNIDAYTETGAAGGNIAFPALARHSVNGFFGAEASAGWDNVRGILRVTYNTDDGYDAQNAIVSLVNAGNAMGTQAVLLPSLGQDHIAPSITFTGTNAVVNWWIGYGANLGLDAGTEHHVSGGLKLAL